MAEHTGLKHLPDMLRSRGLNVIVADNWQHGQCATNDHYQWTDPFTGEAGHDLLPSAYMIHGTAGTAATPPPAATSKAGAWTGLYRNGRLYTTGGGEPTIYLASAGPARISSGYGYRPAAWDYTFQQRRAPERAEGRDSFPRVALNRYAFNVENVHPNDGSPCDPGVWDHIVGLGVCLEEIADRREMALAHRSWTQRKPVDPSFCVGLPNDGPSCIVDIQDAIASAHEETPMTFKDWANGMFDLFDDDEIDDLYNAGYIQGAADAPVYWKGMRDLGSEGRTLEQRSEVARFIQTSQVSAWLKAAQQ